MGERSSRPHLPVLSGLLAERAAGGPPSLDEARANLGGAWVGGPEVGREVVLLDASGERRGVVVHATPGERDVWIGRGRITRVPAARVRELAPDAPPDEELTAIADDARVHAALTVGQPVAVQLHDGTVEQGVVAERLRYGALVGLADGRVLAVSFRRLAPVGTGPTA